MPYPTVIPVPRASREEVSGDVFHAYPSRIPATIPYQRCTEGGLQSLSLYRGGVWTTRRCTDPGVRVTMSPFQDQYGRAFSESQPSAGARPSVISVVPAPMIGEFGVQRGDSTEPGVRALRTRSTTRGE